MALADGSGFVNDRSQCDAQQAYVLDATALHWSNSFVAGTQFWPPTLVANLTGADGSSGKSGSNQGYSAGGDYDPFATPTNAGRGNDNGGTSYRTYTVNGRPEVATMPPSSQRSSTGLSTGAMCVRTRKSARLIMQRWHHHRSARRSRSADRHRAAVLATTAQPRGSLLRHR